MPRLRSRECGTEKRGVPRELRGKGQAHGEEGACAILEPDRLRTLEAIHRLGENSHAGSVLKGNL